MLVVVGLFGTALLYGDGMITPALSVLSAVEGTTVATDRFADWVLPIACLILVGLFSVQRRGTATIGRIFGSVMVVWFSTLAILGAIHVAPPTIGPSERPFGGSPGWIDAIRAVSARPDSRPSQPGLDRRDPGRSGPSYRPPPSEPQASEVVCCQAHAGVGACANGRAKPR